MYMIAQGLLDSVPYEDMASDKFGKIFSHLATTLQSDRELIPWTRTRHLAHVATQQGTLHIVYADPINGVGALYTQLHPDVKMHKLGNVAHAQPWAYL